MNKLLAVASIVTLIFAVQGGLVKAEPLDAKTNAGGDSAVLVLAESGDAPGIALVQEALATEPAPSMAGLAAASERQTMADVFAKLLILATVAGAEPIARLAVTGR